MAQLHFTSWLKELVPDAPVEAEGATAGSLWVSENAGEAWQLVNAHLPPIYAVRLY